MANTTRTFNEAGEVIAQTSERMETAQVAALYTTAGILAVSAIALVAEGVGTLYRAIRLNHDRGVMDDVLSTAQEKMVRNAVDTADNIATPAGK